MKIRDAQTWDYQQRIESMAEAIGLYRDGDSDLEELHTRLAIDAVAIRAAVIASTPHTNVTPQ